MNRSPGYSAKADREKAQLMKDIGKGVKMTYYTGPSPSSGAYSSDAASYLKSSGYKNVAFKSYSFSTLKSKLKQTSSASKHMILYIRGTGTNGGHAWVADGYKIVEKWDVYALDADPSITDDRNHRRTKHIHMNWGWGSYGDGWVTYDYWQPKGSRDASDAYNGNKKFILYDMTYIKISPLGYNYI